MSIIFKNIFNIGLKNFYIKKITTYLAKFNPKIYINNLAFLEATLVGE